MSTSYTHGPLVNLKGERRFKIGSWKLIYIYITKLYFEYHVYCKIYDIRQIFETTINLVPLVYCISLNRIKGHYFLAINLIQYWSLQPEMSTILKTVFLPYVNLHLIRGFPVPILHGFTLQDAEIVCTNSTVIVYSDLVSTKKYLYAVM